MNSVLRRTFAVDNFRDTGASFSYAKKFHDWGQGESFFAYYIDRWTDQDAIIFDPFTGGGTVPAACKMLGRRYLAFEIDPEVADRARKRVQETQPPLFVEQPTQQELFSERP